MRKYLLATTATLLFATPAAASDGSWYAGLEAGALFPKDQDADVLVDYTTTNASVPPGGLLPLNIPPGPSDRVFHNMCAPDR